jgi:hypothetical protein
VEPAGEDAVEFAGYRLEADRVPVFLLRVGERLVEERLDPAGAGLQRTLRGEPAALARLRLSHPGGVTVTEDHEAGPGRRRFTYSWP